MRDFVCGVAAMVLALCSPVGASAQVTPPLFACPSEEVVKTTIQKRAIEFNTGAVGIRSIGGFQFSAVAYGEIAQAHSKISDGPMDVCPLVVNYQWVLTANNGEQMHRIWPVNTIHYFFHDKDGNWTYLTGDQVK